MRGKNRRISKDSFEKNFFEFFERSPRSVSVFPNDFSRANFFYFLQKFSGQDFFENSSGPGIFFKERPRLMRGARVFPAPGNFRQRSPIVVVSREFFIIMRPGMLPGRSAGWTRSSYPPSGNLRRRGDIHHRRW